MKPIDLIKRACQAQKCSLKKINFGNRNFHFFLFIFLFFLPFSFAKEITQKFSFINDQKTEITNPLELRDPFKIPLMKKNKSLKKGTGISFDQNTYSNMKKVEDLSLEKIKITGVIIADKRLAIAKIIGDSSDESIVLSEGMTFSEGNAELKAILPGGVVVVEKIKNVYDQDEFLETIIPISGE